ncbi:hypothetical protein E3P86_00911 [Wallemia ichthyophaga]|uniref:CID domain-containing protein n=1 Tax=Wallemia ichthyophaga TaxID=245174 RepID=A0A4T0JHT8_WALIC|nr:hypothetical protein E3P86_00911 [Wallemia ichthyophaga]
MYWLIQRDRETLKPLPLLSEFPAQIISFSRTSTAPSSWTTNSMSLKEFDDLLRETVIHRSTLSNTRVERISYICGKNLNMGSQHMASSILETHRDKKAKRVSSLYTLHALVQQAHKAIKKSNRDSNNWKNFLSAIESILVDFFDESLKYLDKELKVELILNSLKEKNLKILKMWSQMAVFNKPMLEILMDKMSNSGEINESQKQSDRDTLDARHESSSNKNVSEKGAFINSYYIQINCIDVVNHSDTANSSSKKDDGDSNGGLPANILQFLSKIPSSDDKNSQTPSSDSGSLKRDRSNNDRYDSRYDDRYNDRYNERYDYGNRDRSARLPQSIQNQSYDSGKRPRIDPRTKRPIESSRESFSTNSPSNTHSYSHYSQPNHMSYNSYQQDQKSPTPDSSNNYSHSHSNNKSVDALSNFDWVAFDPTQPQSWILAGKAFEKTFGFVPSNEQIGSCAFMWVYYTNMQTMQMAQQQQPMDQTAVNDIRGRSTSRSRSRSNTPLHD